MNKVLPFRQPLVWEVTISASRRPAVMKIKPFRLCNNDNAQRRPNWDVSTLEWDIEQ
jgi:hypothetical protein